MPYLSLVITFDVDGARLCHGGDEEIECDRPGADPEPLRYNMNSAAFDGERSVSARAHEIGVVCRHHDRSPIGRELTKRRGEIAAAGGIKRCGRLVQEQDA